MRKRVAEQRFRRINARVSGPAPKWPQGVPFEDRVIERILRDSHAVLMQQDHADQLPLLQHLLFWTWRAAVARCPSSIVPDRIGLQDVWQALDTIAGSAQPDSVNTLETCLENHCEAIFNSNAALQPEWESIFRSLAFKEPNTGTYTQQRASIDALRNRESVRTPGGPDTLDEVLAPWMGPHSFINWDRASNTVKVAHETLVRRWARLRRWIDYEDRQFQVYLRLLEDCNAWQSGGCQDSALTSTGAIRRFEEMGLTAALQDNRKTARFTQLLALHRDAERLVASAAAAPEFLRASIEYRRQVAERQRAFEEDVKRDNERAAETRRAAQMLAARAAATEAEAKALKASEAVAKAQKRVWNVTAFVAIATAIIAGALAMTANKEIAVEAAYVLGAETQLSFDPNSVGFDELQLPLRNALLAAQEFETGRKLSDGIAAVPVLSSLLGHDRATLDLAERLAERRNLNSLESIVQNAAWQVKMFTPAAPGTTQRRCSIASPPGEGRVRSGTIGEFFGSSAAGASRGLIVTKDDAGSILVFAGTWSGQGPVCLPKNQIFSTPQGEISRVGVAQDVSNVVFEFPDYWQFYSVQGDDLERSQFISRGVIRKAANAIAAQLPADIGLLPSARRKYATDVIIADTAVRLFDRAPTQMPINELNHPVALTPGKVCAGFAGTRSSGDQLQILEAIGKSGEPSYCLFVEKRDDGVKPLLLATLYAFKNGIATGNRLPLPVLDQQPVGSSAIIQFKVGSDGWLAYTTDGSRWLGLPWSLTAWRLLAADVFEPGKADTLKDPASQRRKRVYDLIFAKNADHPTDLQLKDALDALRPRP